MGTHFSTVPVETVRRNAPLQEAEPVRPLVLVVEEEPIRAETLTAILDKNGLSSFVARDATTALDLAFLAPPDLLIVDAALPGMGGLDLAVRIRQSLPDCDVILFSSHVCGHPMFERLERAAREFVILIKPVHPADLLEQVFRCLQGHRFPALVSPISLIPRWYEFGRSGRRLETNSAEAEVVLRQRMRAVPPPD